jgi:hypothetical protein
VKVKIAGLYVEVLADAEIIASKCMLVSIPAKVVNGHWDWYAPGTKKGFPCSLCGQDCILGPSRQAIEAAKQNPVVCVDCAEMAVREAS